MPTEFELIRAHFRLPTRHTDLAGGDDAALVSVGRDRQLVISTDMLVEGTHFFADTDPEELGWKALAVNLSDLAAMAAEPRWAVLALALPDADETWIAGFARGLRACADAYRVDLVGGDTTRGPRTLCMTVFGEVERGRAVTRAGARPGDELWVSGTPGRAALGLAHLRGEITLGEGGRDACLAALHRPVPRIALGQDLRDVASAMLDVSDGVLGDLSHILEQSRCGAIIDAPALPLATLIACGASPQRACDALLGGGDDYELLFTAPVSRRAAIEALSAAHALPLTRIGSIDDQPGVLRLRDADGKLSHLARSGYDHFD